MDEKLWRVFENVNKWLEYSEQKNAIILTFIGLQLTIGSIFIKNSDVWFKVSAIILGICFLLTLLSFFPKTAIPNWIYNRAKSSRKPSENDNLIFYGDIIKYSQQEYIEKLEKYFSGEIKGHKDLEDICTQITVNSQIAFTKYRVFKTITWLMVIGQMLFLASFWL